MNLYLLSAATELFAALVTTVLLMGCLTEKRRFDIPDRLFFCILLADTALLVSDAAVCLLLNDPSPARVLPVKLLTLLVDVLMNGMMVLYTYFLTCYISQRKPVSHWYARSMAAVCAATVILESICLHGSAYIGYNAAGAEYEGPLFPLVQLIGCAMLASNILYTLLHAKLLDCKDTLILAAYGALPLLSMLVEPLWPNTPPLLATTLSLVLVFVVIHMQLSRSFAQQALRLARQEAELSESRARIMLSQIQPHFLYNALGTIETLCTKDPPLAAKTVQDFGQYLRWNMDSLGARGLIPFRGEYEHIRRYLRIEQLRFDDIHVVCDIGCMDFSLPPLTVQPIVENAVKHGIRGRKGGGTVTISTREKPDCYQITVMDDGVGFDTEAAHSADRSHIGLQNVRERLAQMCGGTLALESRPGEGTLATVTIPKRRNGA